MNKLLIGQLQFHIDYNDIRTNIDTALGLADKALSQQKIDFLSLPEMWGTGFCVKNRLLENIESTLYILNKLAQIAAHYETHIICGSLPELDKGRLYNTSFLINERGEITGKYRKHHLFPLMDETTLFDPGEPPQALATHAGMIGLAICYDLRFPSIFQQLRQQKARIIFLQAQFPAPRVDHWITLCKARAIENQVFVVATNAIGQSGKFDFFGRSLIINPWGEILSDAQDGQGYFLFPIDLNEVDQTREKLPMGFNAN